MDSKINYTTVGIFVIVLTSVFIIMIFWLGSFNNSKTYNAYMVQVRENVTGLSTDSAVRFNGVKVGLVSAIRLDPSNSRLVELILKIESDVKITTSTYAILNEQGITGVIYVNLKAQTEMAPLLKALPGQKYPVIPSKPSLLMQLSEVLPEMTKDIQNLSSSIAQVMDQKNRAAFSASLQNMADFTKTLAINSENLTETLDSLRESLSNISLASKNMPEVMNKLNTALSSVTTTSNSINNTMQTGNVVLRSFSNQVMPNAEQALSSLNSATTNMDLLMSELQRDPSMLVRGREPKQPGPGELGENQ